MDPYEACILGVSIHAKAGLLAQDKFGIVSASAEEVLENIPGAFLSYQES